MVAYTVLDTSAMLTFTVDELTALTSDVLVLPVSTISELEAKRSHSTLGFLARSWLREVEKGRRELKVETNHTNLGSLPPHLHEKTVDNTVLAVCVNLRNEGNEVHLATMDLPMRLHATLDCHLPARELKRSTEPYSGVVSVEASPELLDGSVNPASFYPTDGPTHSLFNLTVDGVVVYSWLHCDGRFELVPRKVKASKITGANLEQDMALTYLKKTAVELPLVSLAGSAGTGKTLITLAAALEAVAANEYDRILVLRSLHEMGNGQELGFLPGDVNEKMNPWAGAVSDSVSFIASKKKIDPKVLLSKIEVSPITYLRGRSLDRTFIVLDEAQNFSRSELLNIITRAGEGSKVVLCFDSAQVDNRFVGSGSNAEVWSVVDGFKDSPLFAHMTLKETKRSRLAEAAARLLA